MALVLHSLRPGDLFVDVGANVGSYTILAGGVCGASVLSVEPIPTTFGDLLDNIRLNHLESLVSPKNLGIGARRGTIKFTESLDTVNHVLAENEAGSEKGIEVPLETLDRLLEGLSPSVIKIDVEGYETEVIQGAASTLTNVNLLALLLELNGSGTRYGFDEDRLHNSLLEKGFVPCLYQPFERKIIPIDGKNPDAGNTLYVRNIAALQDRVATAPAFTVLGQAI
ncbi:MAG: FkbM family methyltransferase [Methylococcaceae bacterium]|nr:FkbM family methyltransferase [Methylococcaceae bacterium]